LLLFAYFFVCLYLIQIHISEPISTKLCTRVPIRLEEVVGYVWTTIFDPFRHFRHLLSGASTEYWAQQGCRSKRHGDSVIFMVWQTTLAPRFIRDVADDNCAKSHPRQPYIRDEADDICAKSHP